VRAAALALTLCLAAGGAAAFQEADWPCQQRKVARLSIGQMWTGPLPADPAAWRDDPDLAALAPRLAARRTPLDEARALVAALGPGPQGDRPARLALLFAGTFALIDNERARLVEGVTRFSRRQRDLALRIDARRGEAEALRAATKPDDFDALDRLEEAEAALVWETRIYQDRQRSVAVVCESPVLMERRAFELGRLIAEAAAAPQ
jgi:hypothetical protein